MQMENPQILSAEIIENHNENYTIDSKKDNYEVSDTYYDYSYKLIIIGNSGAGKSCLIKRAITEDFAFEYQTTIAFEFSSLLVKINNEKIYKLQIWDTCGQEIYRSLIANFYRNASLAMLLYEIDDQKSFDDLKNWVVELREKSNPDIIIFLIGNKCDLEHQRVITKEQGQKFAEENKINYFAETSAKEGTNAKEIFIEAAKQLHIYSMTSRSRLSSQSYENYDNPTVFNNEMNNNSTLLGEFDNNKSKKCC